MAARQSDNEAIDHDTNKKTALVAGATGVVWQLGRAKQSVRITEAKTRITETFSQLRIPFAAVAQKKGDHTDAEQW
jgi:hypothetical protein